MKILSFLFFLGILSFQASSQPSVRQHFTTRSNIDFYVNSFQKYQNGVTLEDWTRVTVSINELDPDKEWNYMIYADESTFIDFFSGSLNLDLVRIRIQAINRNFDIAYFDWESDLIPLSDSPYIFVSGQGSGVFDLFISYELGTDPDNRLVAHRPDYYFATLFFHLQIPNP